MTIILAKFLLAHLIGDFLLQPKRWVAHKEEKKAASWVMYAHALIHGLLVVLLFHDASLWSFMLIYTLSHLAIDLMRVYGQRENNSTKWFIVDQVIHLILIIGLAWFMAGRPDLSSWIVPLNLLIYTTAVYFITQPTSIAIAQLMRPWASIIPQNHAPSLEKAGRYIGMLERLFVFGFVVAGHWQGVGFLLAAKSIFRFGDLRQAGDRQLTEYVLIGTLLSFGAASLAAILVRYVV
ncbi:MAG TPA: DUF3307 domain-containing protein [Cyclobacteriaceae bacterium]